MSAGRFTIEQMDELHDPAGVATHRRCGDELRSYASVGPQFAPLYLNDQTRNIESRGITEWSANAHRRGFALFNQSRDGAPAVSIQNADAWKWSGDYIGDDPAILFFNLEDESTMFELGHGRDIVSVLAECTGFEFYLTNRETKFLLCFNHHDFLIAAGDAASWLLALAKRQTGR